MAKKKVSGRCGKVYFCEIINCGKEILNRCENARMCKECSEERGKLMKNLNTYDQSVKNFKYQIEVKEKLIKETKEILERDFKL